MKKQCSRCKKWKEEFTQYPAKGGHFTDYCRACIKPEDGFIRHRKKPRIG